MNVFAIVLIVGLAILIVYECVSLVQSILKKRREKKEQRESVDVVDNEGKEN